MTFEAATDILGRELCPACQMPLPSDATARELHLLRHAIEDLGRILEMLVVDVRSIRHMGIPFKGGR